MTSDRQRYDVSSSGVLSLMGTLIARSTFMNVEIWSDIACPWCYIGKRHFEAALALFPHRADVEVTWRVFELDPSAPPIRDAVPSQVERLAKKYGMSVAQAEAAMKNVTSVAAKAGLDFHLDKTRSGNMLDGHRVLHLAHERGVQ